MMEGHDYMIEMATGFRYIIHLDKFDGETLHCTQCVWVANTGNRVHEFMLNGPSRESELEDMGPSFHRVSALVSLFAWNHPIPKTQ